MNAKPTPKQVLTITPDKIKKLQKIERETPQKEKQGTARQELQKIADELKAFTLKGYNSEEIRAMLQRATISPISKRMLQGIIIDIKKQNGLYTPEQIKRISRLQNDKGNDIDKKAPQTTQQAEQKNTEKNAQNTERQTQPKPQRAMQTTPQEMQEQAVRIKLRIEQQRQEQPQETRTALREIRKVKLKAKQEQTLEQEQNIASIPFDS